MRELEETPAQLPTLPDAVNPLLAKLAPGSSLGASRNIRQINDLFCGIADGWQGSAGAELVDAVLATGAFYRATRGRNTPAIGNAIRLVLQGLDERRDRSLAEIRAFLHKRRDHYNAQSLRNVQIIAEYGANVLAGADTVLAFDYSSTMMAILRQMAERGQRLRLIVPESRDLDGGRPIAQEALACGHSVEFIIDMAFHHFLGETDAVLIGAETIFALGSCWNTVGSFPIAALAREHQVPCYVATELIKIDARSFRGVRKEMKTERYEAILGERASFAHPRQISMQAPNLDEVPPALIEAFLTERGVLAPAHLRAEALCFLESIGISPLHEERGAAPEGASAQSPEKKGADQQ